MFHSLAAAWVLVLTSIAFAASPPVKKPLRVVLVSGAETYQSDQAFAGLAEYLQQAHGMQCEVLTFSPDQTRIIGIQKLLTADTAVFHGDTAQRLHRRNARGHVHCRGADSPARSLRAHCSGWPVAIAQVDGMIAQIHFKGDMARTSGLHRLYSGIRLPHSGRSSLIRYRM